MARRYKDSKSHLPATDRANLALKTPSPKTALRRDGYAGKVVPKAISRARVDIATWKSALNAAGNVDTPRRTKLINLYADIALDAHLTSQMELRMQHTLAAPFEIHSDDALNEEATACLTSAGWVTELNRHILGSVFYGHSLVELTTNAMGVIEVTLLPRQNVVPEAGLLLYSQDSDAGLMYRTIREYGTWVLEFGSRTEYGLLNKAVPHALFKRFAQACWSELCEIYGIPPRYVKTNTQDPEMLDRAASMLRDMGSAAYFIIDQTEEFAFAKGADTNGDVYRNLIALCREEISLLITGAVVGQDTAHGNRSKEESSLKLLDKIVQADRRMLAGAWNETVIPALVRIGLLKQGDTYVPAQEEDIDKLWAMTLGVLPYKDVPNEWFADKFGIKVEDKKTPDLAIDLPGKKLSADFFD